MVERQDMDPDGMLALGGQYLVDRAHEHHRVAATGYRQRKSLTVDDAAVDERACGGANRVEPTAVERCFRTDGLRCHAHEKPGVGCDGPDKIEATM